MDKKTLIVKAIQGSISAKEVALKDENFISEAGKIVDAIANAFRNGKKVLLCGNGGSAADAQHLAAEFSGRFYIDRKPLPAEALHINTSFLTAVANDYSFNEVFARAVNAHGKEGDILIGISTSGNSGNVLRAIEEANKIGMVTVGFAGRSGGKMKDVCNYIIKAPSDDTPRIQEVHILAGHIICELVEKILFGEKNVEE